MEGIIGQYIANKISLSELIKIVNNDAIELIESARTTKELEEIRIFLLGKKGIYKLLERIHNPAVTAAPSFKESRHDNRYS